MSEDRPAPRWGEYASPEELARLRAEQGLPEPATAEPEPVAIPGEPAAAEGAPARPAPRWDGPVTVGLLVLGLWNVIGTIPALLDFGPVFVEAAKLWGVADLEVGEAAFIGGRVLLGIWVVVMAAAIAGSWWRLRRGRTAFWVPLAGAAVAYLAMMIVMAVVLASAPGFLDLVQNPS